MAIVCDICGTDANYFVHIDWIRDKNVTQFDLCENHHNQIMQHYQNLKEKKKELKPVVVNKK